MISNLWQVMDGFNVCHAAVVLATVLLSLTVGISTGEPFLVTSGGNVTGLEEQVNGTTVEVFYGVPYADVPTGQLRFQPPASPLTWSTPRDGTIKPTACWQPDHPKEFDQIEGLRIWKSSTGVSEDCLYVNVWRPKVRSGPKTIMVWFHGGGFWAGSAVLDAYDGSELAAREDVILVTVAYRLGVAGFLWTSVQKRGNVGLLDQQFALTWVRENAANLGGSSDDVTVFGEDAGAISVGFHLLSGSNLFKNAIMQSGSPLASEVVMDKKTVLERSQRVVESLGCSLNGGKAEFQDCLIELSLANLTQIFFEMKLNLFELPLGPCVDGIFLKSHPQKIIESGDIKITDILIGVTTDEGVLAGFYAFKDMISEDGTIKRQKDFLDMMTTVTYGDEKLQQVLLRKYYREVETKYRRLEIMDGAIGDRLVKCPVLDFAQKYTKRGGRVFIYSFEERFSTSPWPQWVGVPHGAEVEIVFGTPLEENSGISEDERYRIEEIMQHWVRFAKTGVPSGPGVNWPRFISWSGEYVKLDSKGLTPASQFRFDKCRVWLEHKGTHSGNELRPERPEPKPEGPGPKPEGPGPEPEMPEPILELEPEPIIELKPEKPEPIIELKPEKPEPILELEPEKPEPILELEPEKPEPILELETEPILELESEKPEPILELEPEKPEPILELEPEKPEPQSEEEDSGDEESLTPENEVNEERAESVTGPIFGEFIRVPVPEAAGEQDSGVDPTNPIRKRSLRLRSDPLEAYREKIEIKARGF